MFEACTQSRTREQRERDETQAMYRHRGQSPYFIDEERIRSEPESSIFRNRKVSEPLEAMGSGKLSHLGVCIVLRPYKYGSLELKTDDLVIAFDETSHQCLCKVTLCPLGDMIPVFRIYQTSEGYKNLAWSWTPETEVAVGIASEIKWKTPRPIAIVPSE
ncbi:hypothetical protein AC579_7075 [Pseudocercospora musae]|uniref:Uncharacterized protein n=1 Tax=Pseudocercospora musae TaxID=113226 RepID=A0A139I5L3_9PEZI|nr:hypothetical protein AC579_7075 [Pseudocercospora musae]